MRNCSPILAAVLAAGALLGTAVLQQGCALPAGGCVAEENGRCLFLLKNAPVAILQDERKQNPWIRLDIGEELWMDQKGNASCQT